MGQTLDHDAGSTRELRRPTWVIGATIAVAGILLIAIVAYTGWTTNAGELRAERARIENGLDQGITRTLDQQKSVAWWDDAVVNITRTFEPTFIDANFGVFLTETYGHDEVYIVDGADRPVYAFLNGARAEPSAFEARAAQLAPVIAGARRHGDGTLRARPDSFGAMQAHYDVLKGVLQTAGWNGGILRLDGHPAIVAAISITPNVDLSLTAKDPYLLVSVVRVDEAYMSDLGRSLLIPALRLSAGDETCQGGSISEPFVTDEGQPAGYLSWTTRQPGHPLLAVILPLVVVGVVATGLLSAAMLRRLSRASAALAAREAAARHEATHDALSGLPNRHRFAERTRDALRTEGGSSPRLLVGYLDIDRFKDINDTLGHHTGDELIRRFGERLREHLGPDDLLARFGGDEFAILRDVDSQGAAPPLETLVAAAFRHPLAVDGHDLSVTASLGLACSPDHGTTTEELMRHADIALYEAKRRGRDQTVFFCAEMALELEERREIELELREALNAGKLEIYYQPIVASSAQRVAAVEALLRWFHPIKGPISPSVFIPIAEASGMMPELGEWVLRRAMETASLWPGLEVAINLSPAQFLHADLESLLKDLAAQTGVDPRTITLEVTEGLLLDQSKKTAATLQGLRAFGFKIALDDFGTGFSSLKYLIDFRFDKLKVDRSFVNAISQTGSAQTIVQSVVQMGRALGMEVVAEGVETEAEAVLMRFLGCDFMQGYLFSEPLPESGVAGFIRAFEDAGEAHAVAVAGRALFRQDAAG